MTLIVRKNGRTMLSTLPSMVKEIVLAAYRIVRTYIQGNHGRSITVEFSSYPINERTHFQETRITVWCRAVREREEAA